jgi:peroxiredoxin
MSVSALEKEWIEQEKAHRSLAYGNFAENFVATDYNGERIDTKELNDKVLVVAFYYNICPPCMLMLQDLEKLYQNIASEDLKIVAINPIDNQFDNNELREFANKRKLSYHLCGVKRKTIEESYLIYSYPTIFIIDKEGKIRFSHQGYNDLFYEKVDKVIRKIL